MYPFLQSLPCAWQCWEILGQLLTNGYCTLCFKKLPHCPWWGVIQFCLKVSWDSVSVCSKQDEFQGKTHIHINSWIGTNKKDVLQWLNLDVLLGFLLPSAFPGCSLDLVLETSRQLWQSGGSSRIRKITFGKAAHVCVPAGTKQPDHWGFVFLFWLCVIDLAKLKRFPGVSAHPKIACCPSKLLLRSIRLCHLTANWFFGG